MPTVGLTETMNAYLQSEPEFRKAMLSEIASCLLTGEVREGTSLLRKYVTATIGFRELEKALQRSTGSLERALEKSECALAIDLFSIIAYLEQLEGSMLEAVQWAA